MNIRALAQEDADLFWTLRLEGLLDSPEAFGSDYEESKAMPVEEAQQRFRTRSIGGDNFILGAFYEADRLVGVTGFFREEGPKNRHKGFIWGVYVTPAARGKHLGRRLVEESIARVRKIEGVEQIHLTVTTGNPARHLYTSLGFEEYGVEPRSLKVGDKYHDEAMMVLRLS